MFKTILNSFARAYGKGLGYFAARSTSWLAIPLLIIVVVMGVAELGGVQGVIQQVSRFIHIGGF
jgi:hypothetical protein